MKYKLNMVKKQISQGQRAIEDKKKFSYLDGETQG
jgi:hypothetical protein